MKWLRDMLGSNTGTLDAQREAAYVAWRSRPADLAAAFRRGGRRIVVATTEDPAGGWLHVGAVALGEAGIATDDAFVLTLTADVQTRDTPAAIDGAGIDALLAFLDWAGHAPLFAMRAADCARRFAVATRSLLGREADLVWCDLAALLAVAVPETAADARGGGSDTQPAGKPADKAAGGDDPLLTAHADACLLLVAEAKVQADGRALADVVRRPGGGRL